MSYRKCFRVDECKMELKQQHPLIIEVCCKGKVSTTGWTDCKLVLQRGGALINGMCEFDFCATPPAAHEATLPVLIEVEACYTLKGEELPDGFHGVKINAEHNYCETRECIQPEPEPCPPTYPPHDHEHGEGQYTPTPPPPPRPWHPTCEPVFGVEIKDGNLKICVASHGCTSVDDFEICIESNEKGYSPKVLGIYRIKADHCEHDHIEYVELDFSCEDLGIEPWDTFILKNQLGKPLCIH